MYTKDKTNRITLRLNDDQMQFVRSSADLMSISPSDFIRMVINMTMFGTQVKADTALKEGLRRENEQTDIDDLI